ncbi:MAG TPA: Wzt carbohydrate-binding domain-containing protein, partial [Desulfomonilaceae bacterium]|nr:Wzt carbohydrate-binding domain-containing protein [Desulfomonilaceae bacterium]
ERLVFRSEQRRLERRIAGGVPAEWAAIHNSRIFGENDEALTEIAAGQPFGVEIDLSMHRELRRPVFSLGIYNAAGILCKWDTSREDWSSDVCAGNRHVLRTWFPENHLSTGAYEVHVIVTDSASCEAAEQKARIASFAIIGNRRARGIVAGRCRWALIPHPSGPQQETESIGSR